MKQKIIYILMIITALLGRNELVYGQTGYVLKHTNDISFTKQNTELSYNSGKMTINNESKINDETFTVTFTLGDNLKSYDNTANGLRISENKLNYFRWSIDNRLHSINVTKLKANVTSSGATGQMVFTSSDNKITKSITPQWFSQDIELSEMNLNNDAYIKLETKKGTWLSFYIHKLTYTYTLSYYELDISSLNTAIEDAKEISVNDLEGFTKTTFTNALEKAKTVQKESVFPTSYWDGSNSQGKQNPTTVNNATSAFRGALELAIAYLEAKAEINNLKAQGWPKGLSVNVNNALTELNNATDKNGINNAKNNAKNLISIILERNLPEKKFFTLTLPFDYNLKGIKNGANVAYAAQLALVTHNEHDCYTLYFKKVEDGQMRANQPYIVWLPVGFDVLDFGNVGVNFGEEGSITVNGWTMKGNYSQLSMTDKFGIAEGVFRKGGTNSTINAYTAYFIPPTHSHGTENVRARVAVMDEGGNTTYIGEVSDLNGNAPEEVFGIDGMRLPEMRKGINIVRQKDGSVRKIVK